MFLYLWAIFWVVAFIKFSPYATAFVMPCGEWFSAPSKWPFTIRATATIGSRP